jgi:hypothetical protein
MRDSLEWSARAQQRQHIRLTKGTDNQRLRRRLTLFGRGGVGAEEAAGAGEWGG